MPELSRRYLLIGGAGDIAYPHYLINGRTAEASTTLTAGPDQRVRIRIINAGSDTAFRVALGGHRMTMTHTDGFPVSPTQTDAVLFGMGERHDIVVTARDGVFPLIAAAEGKAGQAMVVVRTGTGSTPRGTLILKELSRKVLIGNDLTAAESARLVRLRFQNRTMMFHPMHLHGHTFGLVSGGARKDTVIVRPMQTVDVDLNADNPVQWAAHCHNIYHAEAGMMTTLSYET